MSKYSFKKSTEKYQPTPPIENGVHAAAVVQVADIGLQPAFDRDKDPEDQLAVAEGSVVQNLIQLYAALGGGWQIRLNNNAVERLPAIDPSVEAVPLPEPTAPSQSPPVQGP